MKRTTQLLLSILIGTTSSVASASQCTVDQMNVIGQKARITINELDSDYRARIDTGATRTSLHATNIEVIDGVDELEANIGKSIRFVTNNEFGNHQQHEAEIVATRSIRNSFGSETRYSIDLTLVHNGFSKSIQVNLRDRSNMNDKLLIGRDWLSCQYLVDVSQNSTM